jgi:hypothetical protein
MPRTPFSSSPNIRFFSQDLNPTIDPTLISHRSGKKIICSCPDCKHIWKSYPHILNKCPYCVNQSRCMKLSCIMCFNNSSASRHFNQIDHYILFTKLKHKYKLEINKEKKILFAISIFILFKQSLAKYDYKKNLQSCRTLAFSGHAESYYICRKCNHSFPSDSARIETYLDCPYCSPNNAKMLCDINKNCKKCFEKSFASNSKSKFWDYREGKNKGLTPHDVFISGGHVADFLCDICNHEFNATCNNVTTGYWCPYCCGYKRCSLATCDMCNNRKLSSHYMAQFWDYTKNPTDINPEKLALTNAREKYWFKCPSSKHLSFKITPSHINRGQSCPSCYRKTEAKLGSFLSGISNYIKEYKPSWLYNPYTKAHSSFDFFLDGIIIELDGLHHFVDGRYHGKHYNQNKIGSSDSEQNRQKDISKMIKANSNNISGIRLYQPDIFDDKYNWKEWLQTAIATCKDSKTPIWVFPSNENYSRLIELCIEKNISYKINLIKQ